MGHKHDGAVRRGTGSGLRVELLDILQSGRSELDSRNEQSGSAGGRLGGQPGGINRVFLSCKGWKGRTNRRRAFSQTVCGALHRGSISLTGTTCRFSCRRSVRRIPDTALRWCRNPIIASLTTGIRRGWLVRGANDRLDNVFIPEHRTIPSTKLMGGPSPGSKINPGALYRVPPLTLGTVFASPALGIAKGGLGMIEDDLSSRNTVGNAPMAELPTAQVLFPGWGADRGGRSPASQGLRRCDGDCRGGRRA